MLKSAALSTRGDACNCVSYYATMFDLRPRMRWPDRVGRIEGCAKHVAGAGKDSIGRTNSRGRTEIGRTTSPALHHCPSNS